MKSYSGNNRASGENERDTKRTRLWYSVLIGGAVLIVALAITLAVVFSRPDELPVVITPEPDPPVVAEQPVYYAPVGGGIIREAALDKLVHMPSLNMWKTHNGVDFAASEGGKVVAVTDGKVIGVQSTTLEGVVVTVEHKDGLVSVYKSLSEAAVAEGDVVTGGQEIGTVGTMMTEASDGIHLHLEMLLKGEHVNPLTYLDTEILK
ncbi:MAG: M23 family metallopeptidase [Clostridiales bacterium]|jgi:murein DD-endopeptidase MepM/ murein hydrolase activator NlpD|nr:M23 family metallopeptidase [Clostridiales bacterium]